MLDIRLDVYINDYLLKRNLHASAKAFQAEGEVSPDLVAIDAPSGFLFEWWSVFWDIFIARTNEKHSEAAASYIELTRLESCNRSLNNIRKCILCKGMLLNNSSNNNKTSNNSKDEMGPNFLMELPMG